MLQINVFRKDRQLKYLIWKQEFEKERIKTQQVKLRSHTCPSFWKNLSHTFYILLFPTQSAHPLPLTSPSHFSGSVWVLKLCPKPVLPVTCPREVRSREERPGVRRSGFQPGLHHLPAMCHWASSFTHLHPKSSGNNDSPFQTDSKFTWDNVDQGLLKLQWAVPSMARALLRILQPCGPH